ncbi:MAG: hypothetical protein ACK4WC_01825 [Rubrimonas sp.]
MAPEVWLAFANALLWAALGGRAGRLAVGDRAIRLPNRAGGFAPITAGAAAALTRRAASC